ncbi:MAG: ABC transporter substrate-binding protein [Halobacteriales archaeon]|nr:ABC transporter substrate-binding protein [Halobacteriales archaeon]
MTRTSRRTLLKGLGAGSVAGLTGLAGCTGGDGGDGGDGGAATDTATGTPGDMGPTEFTAGVFGPFTGPFAPWGPATELGATLAAENLEEELGVDITINTYDTEVNPSAALDRMKRAVTADGVDFTQGALSSAVCTTIGTWASDNGVIYLADGASDTLTGANCKPYMFRTYPSNTMMSRSVAPRMADIADSWYVMYSDYVWGQNAQGTITKLLEEEGSSVAGVEATPFPHDDYTQFLNNAVNADVEGIAMILPGLEPTKALQQARNQGALEGHKIMVHQNEAMTQWSLGKWAAAQLDASAVGWNNAVEGGEEFKTSVADRGDVDPMVRHYTAFIAMDQVVRAAVRAGSKDAEDIRLELEGHEIESEAVKAVESGTQYWRACDHSLVKPVYTISGRSEGDMTDSPYKSWFNVESSLAGDDVIRACEETGCSF